MKRRRCAWAEGGGPLETEYHDSEWGVPSFDDTHLFEMLSLEGAQAGLSWSTILRKRDGYRRAFAGFDPVKVSHFDRAKIAALLRDPRIVRHRGKIASVVSNAGAVAAIREEFGSLAAYLWRFVGGRPLQNRRRGLAQLPAETAESRAMSKDLRRRGFRFVGPVTCYSLMQAVGMVNDHEVRCFRHGELRDTPRPRRRP